MKRKPVIGLSGSRIRMEGGYLTGMEKSLVNSDYLDAVLRVGGLPVIIPPTATAAEIDDYLEMCDGILMTGGTAQLRHFGAYAGVDDKILPQRAGKGKPMALQQLLDDSGIGKCGHGGLLAG